jgi:methyl-accepting chemotaxis protein
LFLIFEVINNNSKNKNLLVFNAAIEATRACKMRRGYAVVANEIKNLANQAQKSSRHSKPCSIKTKKYR